MTYSPRCDIVPGFDLDLTVSNNKCFDASQREAHSDVRITASASFIQKLLAVNYRLLEMVDLIF